MDRDTQENACECWQKNGQSGPFYAAGLPINCDAGGATGEVEKGEQRGAQGGLPGPSV